MAEYGKLFARIWSDGQFTQLDAREQQVYALLISFSTRNLAGVLPLTLKRWANATADASIENVTRALESLSAKTFVVVDWDTEELLVRTFIRNDEVYRQPNLMKAALKFASQVESQALRWALHDELLRLPDHKDATKTTETAYALVEGLSRTPAEPLAEPFGEGLPKPPGVGVSYVGKGNTSTHNEHQAPTPAAVAIAEPIDAESATPGAELVNAIIPREHPAAVKTALRIRASELLRSGTPKPIVDAALRLWLTKPNLGPNTLASLVSEVIKTRAAPHPNAPNGPSAADTKVNDWLALANPTANDTRKALE